MSSSDYSGEASNDRDRHISEQLAAATRDIGALSPPPKSPYLAVRILDAVTEALAALSLLAITSVLLMNVLARYLFDQPIGWATEVATGLLVWLTMLGTFVAARRGDLITVQILAGKFPARLRAAIRAAMAAVGSLGLGYLAWAGVQFVQTFGGDTTPYLGVPKGWTYAAIPLGVLALLLTVLLTLRERDGLARSEAWPGRRPDKDQDVADDGPGKP